MINSFTTAMFIINLIIALLIIKKCKLSIFSVKTLAVNYILLPLFYQYLTGASYGLLELNASSIYYNYILISLLIYNSIFYILLSFSKTLDQEKQKLKNGFSVKGLTKFILISIAIICAIIAFPTMPFSYNAETRFQALLPGHAWNHIAIISLIFLIGNLRKDHGVQFAYLFCIFWFLSHYERVDIVGLLIVVAIYMVMQNDKIKDKIKSSLSLAKIRRRLGITIAAVLAFILMTFIGVMRSGSQTGSSLIKNIVVQKTAADVAYIYNSSVDYEQNHGKLYGKTYGQYIAEIIPFTNYQDSVSNILDQNYPYPGGEYILSAPVMNFGLLGVPIMAIFEFYILNLLIKSKHKISIFMYLFLTATIFRSNWYGLGYIETGLIYIVPIFYIFGAKMTKAIKYRSTNE